jgi:hypothetical protein
MPVRKRDSKGRPVKRKTVVPDTEVVKTHIDQQRGSVTIEKGITKNIGDFSSARISVRLTLPIGFTPDDVVEAKRTMKKVTRIIDDEMDEQAEDIVELLRSIE